MKDPRRLSLSGRTLTDLAHPAPEGQRHGQMVRLALDLLRAGLVAEAVFVQLRSQYGESVPDGEIRKVLAWADANQTPRTGLPAAVRRGGNAGGGHAAATIGRVETWLKGLRVTEADLFEASPWRPPEDFRLDGAMLLAGLYDAADHINIVTQHEVVPGDPAKASPRGAGTTLRRDDWLKTIREQGTPEGAAGAWVRLNPVRPGGSGHAGAFTDADTTAHRFLLVESDLLPLELQLSALATLRMPVAAIIASGGRSCHAWVRLDAADADAYRALGQRIFGILGPLGFDPQNANPSRLSRFPGAHRQIGAASDGRQRLIYLNPDAHGNQPIFERK